MRKIPNILVVLTTLVLMASVGFSADKTRAVVVGIDNYDGIKDSQKGCVNDAKAMAEQLSKRGITATVLLNEDATKDAILEAINKNGKGADKLVFYFAGLGSGPSTPRLLTYDNVRGIALDDLDETLLKLGADDVTVLLDTCFAGSRAEKDGPSLYRNRYYTPIKASSRSLAKLGADTSEIPGLSHEKICYVTASRFNEEAFEDKFKDKHHGVFTYFLCNKLDGGEKVTWRSIQWDVGAKVASHLQDQQHPKFPTAYLASGIDFNGNDSFAGRPSNGGPQTAMVAEPRPVEGSLWNLFNIDNQNRSLVKVSMRPNQTEVQVEQPLEFDIEIGKKSGYLLVVEHSVEGNLQPIFPRNGKIASAKVQAGQKITIPDSRTLAYADRPGKERIKAFLFEDKTLAENLLGGLTAPQLDTSSAPKFGCISEELQSRSIKFVPTAEFGRSSGKVQRKSVNGTTPFTDDLTFQVVPKT